MEKPVFEKISSMILIVELRAQSKHLKYHNRVGIYLPDGLCFLNGNKITIAAWFLIQIVPGYSNKSPDTSSCAFPPTNGYFAHCLLVE